MHTSKADNYRVKVKPPQSSADSSSGRFSAFCCSSGVTFHRPLSSSMPLVASLATPKDKFYTIDMLPLPWKIKKDDIYDGDNQRKPSSCPHLLSNTDHQQVSQTTSTSYGTPEYKQNKQSNDLVVCIDILLVCLSP